MSSSETSNVFAKTNRNHKKHHHNDGFEKYMAFDISSDYDFKRVEYPSVSPSSAPTSTPIASPSSTPTSTPSVAPSSTPTSTPSVSPSSTPTSTPSVAPSSAPTSTPSVLPSSAPTFNPLVRGCAGVGEEGSDILTTENPIFFDYEMILENTTNVTETLESLENLILSDLASQYLSCPEVSRRHLRSLQEEESNIVQLRSEPMDEIDENLVSCSSTSNLKDDEVCYPIKGAMVYLSTCTSASCRSSEVLLLGSAIKKGCDEDLYASQLPIRKINFIGDRLQVASMISLNNQINAQGASPQVSMMNGGFVIGIVIAAFASFLTALHLYNSRLGDDDDDDDEE